MAASFSYLFSQGVVVGFDGRHNSRRWAFLTAGVFIRAKVTIRVYTLTNTLLEYDNCWKHMLSYHIGGACDSIPDNGANPFCPLHRDEEGCRCGGDGHC